MNVLPVSLNVLHVPDVEERRVLLASQQDALGGIDRIRESVRDYAIHSDRDLPADPRKRSAWPNARRALLAGAEQAPYVMVLQDDMLPAKGFFGAVRQMLRVRPAHPIGLFTLRRKIAGAVPVRGDRWFSSTGGVHGGGYILPAAMARDVVAWCDSHISADYRHDDGRISAYLMRAGQRLWQPLPSPIEHVGAGTSTLGSANRNRVAAWFEPDITGFDYTEMPADPMHFAGGGKATATTLIRSTTYHIGGDW